LSIAKNTSSSIVIDGRLDEADWRAAARSPRFADLIGGRPGIHDTRAAVLWDDARTDIFSFGVDLHRPAFESRPRILRRARW
jgi:hypothetical protein